MKRCLCGLLILTAVLCVFSGCKKDEEITTFDTSTWTETILMPSDIFVRFDPETMELDSSMLSTLVQAKDGSWKLFGVSPLATKAAFDAQLAIAFDNVTDGVEQTEKRIGAYDCTVFSRTLVDTTTSTCFLRFSDDASLYGVMLFTETTGEQPALDAVLSTLRPKLR